jgi:hypothetical protein
MPVKAWFFNVCAQSQSVQVECLLLLVATR